MTTAGSFDPVLDPEPALALDRLVRLHNIIYHPDSIHRSHVYPKNNTILKTSGRCIPQLANMSIDPIELTADVFRIIKIYICRIYYL